MEKVSIKFDGGIATTGKLHFYEYSRSQYAFARIIATIDNYKRTGHVAEKITRNYNVETLISTPEKGSFVVDVLIPIFANSVSITATIPFSSMLSYVWHTLLPREEKTDNYIETLAKIRLAEISANIEAEKERTKQMEVLSSIVAGEQANTREALGLVKWAMNSSNTKLHDSGYTQSTHQAMQYELSAEAQRQAEFSLYADQLALIDEHSLNRLTSRIRPAVEELGLPLRRSADKIFIGAKDVDQPLVYINTDILQSIKNKQQEDSIQIYEVHVKSYDRDAGVGKVSSSSFQRVLNFSVPIRDRAKLIDKIFLAMKQDKVHIVCRRIIDRSGMPTSLILQDVLLRSDYIDNEQIS